MLRKTLSTLAFAGALSVGTGALGAEIHVVTIYDNDFMPPLVFAQPGDTIRFINDDLVPREAVASDFSWSTGAILPGESYELSIYEDTQLLYASADVNDGASEDADAGSEELPDGAVTFEEPPLE